MMVLFNEEDVSSIFLLEAKERSLHPLTSVLVDVATLVLVTLSEVIGELVIAATSVEGAMVAATKKYIFFESMK